MMIMSSFYFATSLILIFRPWLKYALFNELGKEQAIDTSRNCAGIWCSYLVSLDVLYNS